MQIIVQNVNSHGGGKVYDFLMEPRNELQLLPKLQYWNFFLQSKLGLIVSPKTPLEIVAYLLWRRNRQRTIHFFCLSYCPM